MSTLLRIFAALFVVMLFGVAMLTLLAVFLPVVGVHAMGFELPRAGWVQIPFGGPRLALQMTPLLFVLMPVVLLVLLFVVVLPRGNRARLRGRGEGLTEEDLRTIQALHRGFERLNDRIESLETILLSASRRG